LPGSNNNLLEPGNLVHNELFPVHPDHVSPIAANDRPPMLAATTGAA
jgi:hypothetical protein